MTTLLFSVLAATSLAAAGIVAPDETRSAQSLPSDHLVGTTANSGTGKFHTVNRMADASSDNGGWDRSSPSECAAHHRPLKDGQTNCRRDYTPVVIIGAASTGGLIYALTSTGHSSSSGQPPVSN